MKPIDSQELRKRHIEKVVQKVAQTEVEPKSKSKKLKPSSSHRPKPHFKHRDSTTSERSASLDPDLDVERSRYYDYHVADRSVSSTDITKPNKSPEKSKQVAVKSKKKPKIESIPVKQEFIANEDLKNEGLEKSYSKLERCIQRFAKLVEDKQKLAKTYKKTLKRALEATDIFIEEIDNLKMECKSYYLLAI